MEKQDMERTFPKNIFISSAPEIYQRHTDINRPKKKIQG